MPYAHLETYKGHTKSLDHPSWDPLEHWASKLLLEVPDTYIYIYGKFHVWMSP